MSIKQIEKLYKNMVAINDAESGSEKIDSAVRTEIYRKIMDNVDRLLNKMKRFHQDSTQYRETDAEIRNLLLKEIQVIIDDYVVAKRNGTLEQWKAMYGELDRYVRNFHIYRQGDLPDKPENISKKYGFYDYDDLL